MKDIIHLIRLALAALLDKGKVRNPLAYTILGAIAVAVNYGLHQPYLFDILCQIVGNDGALEVRATIIALITAAGFGVGPRTSEQKEELKRRKAARRNDRSGI